MIISICLFLSAHQIEVNILAQRVVITDDLNGQPADQVVTFGLDRDDFEIDLTDANAARLRGSLQEFIARARRSGGRAQQPKRYTTATATSTKTVTTAKSGRPASAEEQAQNRAIREWAKANGHAVADRGRIPDDLRAAYAQAQAATTQAARAAVKRNRAQGTKQK